jgi:hypothetical protein
MTREEASKLSEMYGCGSNLPLLLEKLGVTMPRFDESKDAEINREAASYLAHKVVGVYDATPGGHLAHSRPMALDVQGGAELVQHLNNGGFRLVRT